MEGTGTKLEVRDGHSLLQKQAINMKLQKKHILAIIGEGVVVGRVMVPPNLQDIHTLMPGTSELLLVCMAKEELRLQMKLSLLPVDLRWECFPGLSR